MRRKFGEMSFSQVKMSWLGLEIESVEFEIDGDKRVVRIYESS